MITITRQTTEDIFEEFVKFLPGGVVQAEYPDIDHENNYCNSLYWDDIQFDHQPTKKELSLVEEIEEIEKRDYIAHILIRKAENNKQWVYMINEVDPCDLSIICLGTIKVFDNLYSALNEFLIERKLTDLSVNDPNTKEEIKILDFIFQ